MDHKPSLQVSKPFTRNIHHVYHIIFYLIAISLGIVVISTLCFYSLSLSLQTILYPVTIPFKTLLPPPPLPLSFSQLSITPPPPQSPSPAPPLPLSFLQLSITPPPPPPQSPSPSPPLPLSFSQLSITPPPSPLPLSFSQLSITPPPPQSPSPSPPLSFSQLSITPPPPPQSPSPPPPYQVLPSSLGNTKSKSSSTALKTSIFHNMTDQELFLKASMVQGIDDFTNKTTPKVAFMFLIRGKLPLASLWEKFFKDQEGFYSIYVHQDPSSKVNVREDSAFYGRKIPSQPVVWGTSSMIDAERRLLANALLDFSNQRFVLLSESCIPLFGFKTIYTYLMNSSLSYVQSYYDPTKDCKDRYNPKMSPLINITNWRKGSQWFEFHRDLAINIVHDTKYYPMFKKYCLPRCYSDEHYIPTLVHMMYPELNSNRSITWVDWSIRGPHPRRYVWEDITDELMNKIRFGSTCVYNGNTTNICFLFGRKFHPNTLDPLLRVSPSLLGDYYP